MGVRPEDCEDAGLATEGPHGFTFEPPIELVESMGSEIYAHFGFSGDQIESDELRELDEDAGAGDLPSGAAEGARAIARLDPTSDVRVGRPARLWLDTRNIHIFDPKDGTSLTRRPETAAA